MNVDVIQVGRTALEARVGRRALVTRRGIDTAVVVSLEEWQRLNNEKRLSWKDVLLGEGPRFDLPLPPRGNVKMRKAPVFE